MKQPLISIVTPSYNKVSYIKDTIESVINQSYKNLEYILIDGKSTDGSVDIIKKYEDKIDFFVSEPDRGQAHAINKGFEIASGDILAWINADDYYEINAFEKVADCFSKMPEIDFIYGNFIYISENGTPLRLRRSFHSLSYDLMRYHNFIGQPSVFFRKSLWQKAGCLNEKLYYCLDWELFVRMLKYGNSYYLPETLSYYRLDNTAKMHQEDSTLFIKEAKLIRILHPPTRNKNDFLSLLYETYILGKSLIFRIWLVIRNNPIDYFRTIFLLFPGRRIIKLIISRIKRLL